MQQHFGIWVLSAQRWLMLQHGGIFWTTSRAVAEAQINQSIAFSQDELEVRPFDEPQSPKYVVVPK